MPIRTNSTTRHTHTLQAATDVSLRLIWPPWGTQLIGQHSLVVNARCNPTPSTRGEGYTHSHTHRFEAQEAKVPKHQHAHECAPERAALDCGHLGLQTARQDDRSAMPIQRVVCVLYPATSCAQVSTQQGEPNRRIDGISTKRHRDTPLPPA